MRYSNSSFRCSGVRRNGLAKLSLNSLLLPLGLNGKVVGCPRDFAQRAEVRVGRNANDERGASHRKIAARQWRPCRGTNADILPGKFASDRTGAFAGHSEDQLRRGD